MEKSTPFTKNRHYPTVALSKDGKTIQQFVHRLVAKAFVPNEFQCDIVHHIDENKMNFRFGNLEWTSQAHNVADYIERHAGNTHIDRAKRTLGSPVLEINMNGDFIEKFITPQRTGYHCKEYYDCLKKHIPFRGSLFIYEDEINSVNINDILKNYPDNSVR